MILKLYTGNDEKLYQTFRSILSDVNVEVIKNSISQASGEYIVTAGNSFGFMDGGIDGYINEMISFRKEPRFNVIVRNHIAEVFSGLLGVGQSTILPIRNEFVNLKYLVYSPTMIVPENVNNTLNAFYAYRGALLAVMKHSNKGIVNLCCFCTGAGDMDPQKSAQQLRMAIISLREQNYDWSSALKLSEQINKTR